LNKFDIQTGKAVSFKHDPNKSSTISNNYVNTIYKSNEGSFWIGTRGGLNIINAVKIDTINKTGFRHFKHDRLNSESISGDTVTAVLEINQNLFLVGTSRGLNAFNLSDSTFRLIPVETEDDRFHTSKITDLEFDQFGNLWVGSEDAGLFMADNEEIRSNIFKFINYSNDPSNSRGLSGNNITDIFSDREGNLWVGTFVNGLNLFDRNTKSFRNFTYESKNQKSLSSHAVTSIMQDKTGLLWIGTIRGGMSTLNPISLRFKHILNDPLNKNSLSANGVFTLTRDNKGNLWIGTFSTGLNHFNSKRGQFTHYRHDPLDPGSIPSDLIWDWAKDHLGHIWLATGDGVAKINPETGKIMNLDLSKLKGNHLIFEFGWVTRIKYLDYPLTKIPLLQFPVSVSNQGQSQFCPFPL